MSPLKAILDGVLFCACFAAASFACIELSEAATVAAATSGVSPSLKANWFLVASVACGLAAFVSLIGGCITAMYIADHAEARAPRCKCDHK